MSIDGPLRGANRWASFGTRWLCNAVCDMIDLDRRMWVPEETIAPSIVRLIGG